MAQRTLLFDLDGTLWDSYPWYAEALGRSGAVSADRVLARLHRGESVMGIASALGVSRTRHVSLCRAAGDCLQLYPNVTVTLDRLVERGCKLGLVSNLSRSLVHDAFVTTGLSDYFGAALFAAKKPSPSGILRALSELGAVPNADVYLVGDTEADAAAAHAAGVRFAWAKYGYGVATPANTQRTVSCFEEVLDL